MARRRALLAAVVISVVALVALLLRRPCACEERLVGNEGSRVFHLPDCPRRPSAPDPPTFASRAAALAAGFRPCGVCNP